MKNLISALVKFARDEEGLTMVEYAVAGAVITAGAGAAFGLLGIAVEAEITALKGLIPTP
jgi:pilus assembly protein Flp/PilA